MKKTMKCLIALFVMAMTFVMADTTVKAMEVPNVNELQKVGKADISDFATFDGDVKKVGVYASNYIQQTAATKNSVTITWSSPYSYDAEGYVVYLGNSVYTQTDAATMTTTINGLSEGVLYNVTIGMISGGTLYYLGDDKASSLYTVKTAPKKIASDEMKILWNSKDKIKVQYLDMSAYADGYDIVKYIDGIEFKVKTTKGSTKKTYKKKVTNKTVSAYTVQYDPESLIDSFSFKAPSAIKNKGMQYQVRTYFTLSNGKKVYSDWTGNKAFVPQAKVTKVQKVGTDKCKYTWKKVSGAKSYTIYRTTNGGKKYKKIKTVSKNTTSYVVPGVKANNDKYGVWIRADKVKVGKKKVNSSRSYYTSLEIIYR